MQILLVEDNVMVAKGLIYSLSQQGYDVTFGARPLKRFIQSNIETLVAREMIKGDIKHGSHVTVDYDNNFFITVN